MKPSSTDFRGKISPLLDVCTALSNAISIVAKISKKMTHCFGCDCCGCDWNNRETKTAATYAGIHLFSGGAGWFQSDRYIKNKHLTTLVLQV